MAGSVVDACFSDVKLGIVFKGKSAVIKSAYILYFVKSTVKRGLLNLKYRKGIIAFIANLFIFALCGSFFVLAEDRPTFGINEIIDSGSNVTAIVSFTPGKAASGSIKIGYNTKILKFVSVDKGASNAKTININSGKNGEISIDFDNAGGIVRGNTELAGIDFVLRSDRLSSDDVYAKSFVLYDDRGKLISDNKTADLMYSINSGNMYPEYSEDEFPEEQSNSGNGDNSRSESSNGNTGDSSRSESSNGNTGDSSRSESSNGNTGDNSRGESSNSNTGDNNGNSGNNSVGGNNGNGGGSNNSSVGSGTHTGGSEGSESTVSGGSVNSAGGDSPESPQNSDGTVQVQSNPENVSAFPDVEGTVSGNEQDVSDNDISTPGGAGDPEGTADDAAEEVSEEKDNRVIIVIVISSITVVVVGVLYFLVSRWIDKDDESDEDGKKETDDKE